MTTQAVVFESPGKTAFREIELPEPGPEDVLLRTTRSVISSGTEGWVLQDLFTWEATKYPCVPGYQRVGVVERVGSGVKGIEEGSTWACTWGRWEAPVASQWGSHAALCCTPASELYSIPDGASHDDAAAFVVAQVGYNAASRIAMEQGDWVLVYGDGIIGQFACQAAKARGARVALAGHRSERLQAASLAGADAVVNRKHASVAEALEMAGARPVAIIDTIQTLDCQAEYLPFLEDRTGQIVYSGFTPGAAWADMARLQQKELTTHFVAGWTRARLEATLNLMAEGKMTARSVISHRLPAQQAPDAYAKILAKEPGFVAALLDWTGA